MKSQSPKQAETDQMKRLSYMMEKNCEATTTLQKTQSNIMVRLQKLEDRLKKEQNDAVA